MAADTALDCGTSTPPFLRAQPDSGDLPRYVTSHFRFCRVARRSRGWRRGWMRDISLSAGVFLPRRRYSQPETGLQPHHRSLTLEAAELVWKTMASSLHLQHHEPPKEPSSRSSRERFTCASAASRCTTTVISVTSVLVADVITRYLRERAGITYVRNITVRRQRFCTGRRRTTSLSRRLRTHDRRHAPRRACARYCRLISTCHSASATS